MMHGLKGLVFLLVLCSGLDLSQAQGPNQPRDCVFLGTCESPARAPAQDQYVAIAVGTFPQRVYAIPPGKQFALGLSWNWPTPDDALTSAANSCAQQRLYNTYQSYDCRGVWSVKNGAAAVVKFLRGRMNSWQVGWGYDVNGAINNAVANARRGGIDHRSQVEVHWVRTSNSPLAAGPASYNYNSYTYVEP